MISLGEMSAYLPHKKGFAGYATRFVDPAFGFAVGWNYLMKYLVAPASNINAACIVMQYWTRSVPIEVWSGQFCLHTPTSQPVILCSISYIHRLQ